MCIITSRPDGRAFSPTGAAALAAALRGHRVIPL